MGKVLSSFTFVKLEVSREFFYFQEAYLYLPATSGKGTTGVCGINQVLVKQAEVRQTLWLLSAFLPTSRTDV